MLTTNSLTIKLSNYLTINIKVPQKVDVLFNCKYNMFYRKAKRIYYFFVKKFSKEYKSTSLRITLLSLSNKYIVG